MTKRKGSDIERLTPPVTLFVSDLHLHQDRPLQVKSFVDFLRGAARASDALYVLGDLFEDWVGDDQLCEPLANEVAVALADLTRSGIPVYFQHGNRDFLLGSRFEQKTGAALLPEEKLVNLYGQETLVMHGDQLCTDDIKYQRFRAWSRDSVRQRRFLHLPYFFRRWVAAYSHRRSAGHKAVQSDAIMDVNLHAIEQALRRYHYPKLIHGHTHRPAKHEHWVDGRLCERWVLGDWYEAATFLAVTRDGVNTSHLP